MVILFLLCLTEIMYANELGNFNWKYYIQKHNLNNISSEYQAYTHYQQIGKSNGYKYCRSYEIGIIWHLYDLSLIDDFVDKFNQFIRLNHENDYSIFINIPIEDNVKNFTDLDGYQSSQTSMNFKQLKQCAFYHSYLITEYNYQRLINITAYIKDNLNIENERIIFTFCENRGLDIGGFFMSVDYILNNNILLDYIVKVHTKKEKYFRDNLTQFLGMYINNILYDYDALYCYHLSCSFDSSNSPGAIANRNNLNKLLKQYGLPAKNFYFCGGTMFICSFKLIQFFQPYNRIELFNSLDTTPNGQHPMDGALANAYERFLGYLKTFLGFKVYPLSPIN